jgi:hypothetical protein
MFVYVCVCVRERERDRTDFKNADKIGQSFTVALFRFPIRMPVKMSVIILFYCIEIAHLICLYKMLTLYCCTQYTCVCM